MREYLDDEVLLRDEEACVQLVDALVYDTQGLVERQSLDILPVHDRQCECRAIPVCAVWYLAETTNNMGWGDININIQMGGGGVYVVNVSCMCVLEDRRTYTIMARNQRQHRLNRKKKNVIPCK